MYMERSTSAQVIVAVIPIVGIVMASVIVFFHLLWSHKQKMLLIETRSYEKPHFDLLAFSLFTGLLLGGVGLCLTVFFRISLGRGLGLLGGVIPLAIGVALILFFVIRRRIKD